MLKKINRLPKEVKIKGGKEFSSKFFKLKIAQNNKNFSRFGFVVSKRIDKRAVVRNRIKRQIRFCIEKNIDKITEGIDALFIVRKEVIGKATNDVCFSVEEALKKEKFLK